MDAPGNAWGLVSVFSLQLMYYKIEGMEERRLICHILEYTFFRIFDLVRWMTKSLQEIKSCKRVICLGQYGSRTSISPNIPTWSSWIWRTNILGNHEPKRISGIRWFAWWGRLVLCRKVYLVRNVKKDGKLMQSVSIFLLTLDKSTELINNQIIIQFLWLSFTSRFYPPICDYSNRIGAINNLGNPPLSLFNFSVTVSDVYATKMP